MFLKTQFKKQEREDYNWLVSNKVKRSVKVKENYTSR